MDAAAIANLELQALMLGTARERIAQNQQQPVPASAPASEHAEVVLELSAAAQNLLSR
jgi:hypothetical protein